MINANGVFLIRAITESFVTQMGVGEDSIKRQGNQSTKADLEIKIIVKTDFICASGVKDSFNPGPVGSFQILPKSRSTIIKSPQSYS